MHIGLRRDFDNRREAAKQRTARVGVARLFEARDELFGGEGEQVEGDRSEGRK